MRRLVAMVFGGILLAVWPVAMAAQATPSSPITISSTVDLATEPATGSWAVTWAISDAGTLVEPRLNFVGHVGALQITRVNSGSKGTFTLRITSKVSGVEANGDVDFTGQWVIIAGTGEYANLHGEGGRSAVFHPDTGTVTETLTGGAHFD